MSKMKNTKNQKISHKKTLTIKIKKTLTTNQIDAN